jgi:hypothetical protein
MLDLKTIIDLEFAARLVGRALNTVANTTASQRVA